MAPSSWQKAAGHPVHGSELLQPSLIHSLALLQGGTSPLGHPFQDEGKTDMEFLALHGWIQTPVLTLFSCCVLPGDLSTPMLPHLSSGALRSTSWWFF